MTGFISQIRDTAVNKIEKKISATMDSTVYCEEKETTRNQINI